jgi:adenylosuccinate synthase
MAINPKSLLAEMDTLRALGIDVTPQRLRISHAAHLITPAHQALDAAQESARGKGSIGTTGRGIGPAYTDKASRRGLRISDMLSPDFNDKLAVHLSDSNKSLVQLGAPALEILPILDAFKSYAETIAPYVFDASTELALALSEGKQVLAEGAQGTLLDIDHGTYPFVTSSSTTAPGVLTGLGLGLNIAADARVTGVCKAFQTRVGSGPFPSEVSDDLALRLRGTGEHPWDEYGTTTGRPRRVGWLDGVLLRYAVRINGLTELVITKLDIFSGFGTLKLCVGYKRDGKALSDLPFGPSNLEAFEPAYEELPGWSEDVSGARRMEDLPTAARNYLTRISILAGVPVSLVSVGPEREQVVQVIYRLHIISSDKMHAREV